MTNNFSSKESSVGFAYLKALLEQEILKAIRTMLLVLALAHRAPYGVCRHD
jgi:hypothetical protein